MKDEGKAVTVRAPTRPGASYFVERFGQYGSHEERLVCSARSGAKLRRLLSMLVRSYSDDLEIFVNRMSDLRDYPEWERFVGAKGREDTIAALEEFGDYLFSDGAIRLCVRDKSTLEYVALDEFGTLYIYGSPPSVTELLDFLKFKRRRSARRDHLRRDVRRPDDSEIRFMRLVHRLGLVPAKDGHPGGKGED